MRKKGKIKIKLGILKREICEHTDGKFKFLMVHSARILPELNAIALTKQYEFSWRRTAEKWGSFVLDQLDREYPEIEFKLLEAKELEFYFLERKPLDFLEKKTFEAVIQIKDI